MSNKTLVLLLGGQERTLDFGKTKFLKYLNEICESEDFNILDRDVSFNVGKTYKSVLCLIYAGLCNAGMKTNKEEID